MARPAAREAGPLGVPSTFIDDTRASYNTVTIAYPATRTSLYLSGAP